MPQWQGIITVDDWEASVQISYQPAGETLGSWYGFFVDPSPALQDWLSTTFLKGFAEADTSIGHIVLTGPSRFQGSGPLNLPGS